MAKQKYAKQRFHFNRVVLFGCLLLAFFVVRIDAYETPTIQRISGSVLAYATDMSLGGLLASTNAARAAYGLGPLSLNSQLNSSSQMKAQDMVNKNYWAHVAPDGTQPWYFFSQAGYDYTNAGENLAYGFASSQATVDGWMASQTHKDNILGNYTEVGFGFTNSPSYQSNGNQTIVVAHYGTPRHQAAAPVAPTPPAATPPAPTPAKQPAPAQSATPSTPTPAPADTPDTVQPQNTQKDTQSSSPSATTANNKNANESQAAVAVAIAQAPSRISILNMIASHRLSVAALVGFAILSATVIGYALTHRTALQRAVSEGEHFVIAHPGIDAIAVATITALILLTTYGHVV